MKKSKRGPRTAETNSGAAGRKEIKKSRRSGMRNLFGNLLLACASILTVLLAGEAVFRFLWKSEFDRWIVGPSLSEEAWVYAHYEGDSYYRQFFLAFDPAKVNILGIGDSFTFGEGLHETDELYLSRLEARLNEIRPVDVNNMGRGGNNIGDIVQFATQQLAEGGPDILLYGLNLNDIITPETQRIWDDSRKKPEIISFLEHKSYLFFDLSFRAYSLLDRSQGIDYHQILRTLYKADGPEFAGIRDGLETLKQICEANGSVLVVAILPLLADFANYPFAVAHSLLGRCCEELGIIAIDVLEEFKGYSGRSLWVNPYDAHPGAQAHALIANGIYPVLSELVDQLYPVLHRLPEEKPMTTMVMRKRDEGMALNWGPAISRAERKRERDPENVNNLGNLGLFYLWTGRRDSAVAVLGEMNALDPEYSDALIRHIRVFLEDERYYDRGIEILEILSEINPDSRYHLINLANACYLCRRFDAAVGHFGKAYEMFPSDSEIYNHYIVVLIAKGDYIEARNIAKQIELQGLSLDNDARTELEKANYNKGE